MKRLLCLMMFAVSLLIACQSASAGEWASLIESLKTKSNSREVLQCVAFSPYVDQLNPDYGAHPSRETINLLLDKLIAETPFRCIMTYGVLNGLEYVFAAAEARRIKVIAILWIDNDTAVNSQSIASGIEVAKAFPETIIKLSCGSEVRTRHGNVFDNEILRCIDSLRAAEVVQPITTIDTWWEWCNRAMPCQISSFADKVDWIGANIFPWWENQYSGLFPCTPAEQAADFHIAKLEDLHRTYPGKEIMLTEFGWPNGPEGAPESNRRTGAQCGVPSKENQLKVVVETFNQLAAKKWSGTVFEAFSEYWKPNKEGTSGGYWGLCEGKPPYTCLKDLQKPIQNLK